MPIRRKAMKDGSVVYSGSTGEILAAVVEQVRPNPSKKLGRQVKATKDGSIELVSVIEECAVGPEAFAPGSKADRVASGKLSRRKGRAFEQEIARALRRAFPEARRHLEFQKEVCFGVDIDNTEPYFIQCKRGRQYASITAIEEIKTDVRFGDVPVLVTRADDKEAMAVLPFTAFVEMLERLSGTAS